MPFGRVVTDDIRKIRQVMKPRQKPKDAKSKSFFSSGVILCAPSMQESHLHFPSHRFYLLAGALILTSLMPYMARSAGGKGIKICGGRDSNTRIPTKIGPQPIAFDLARQPPH